MKTRALTRILLLILTCLVAVETYAHDIEVANADGVTIYYNILEDNKLEVTYQGESSNSYTNEYSGEVDIPEQVTYNGTTYSVTSIGGGAFYLCSGMSSVTIPNSVTTIGYGAFGNCRGLTSITIPNSVTTIDYAAFENCRGLTSVIIPNSVTSIGDYAFYACNSLTSVTIPNSMTGIGDYTFYGCWGLTSVTIPNSVTSIDHYAFAYCESLTSVYCYARTVPNTISNAFEGSNYENSTLHVPASSIDSYKDTEPWSGFGTIEAIRMTEEIDGINYEYDTETRNAIVIEKNPEYSGDIVIPSSIVVDDTECFVTSIGDNAFAWCKGLTSMTIPNSVTSIGSYAFFCCSGLTSVTIPNSVTSIGDDAFSNCRSLTAITIPNSVTSIGEGSFGNCHSLTSVTMPSNMTSIKRWTFDGCSSLTAVTIPSSVTSIENGAFQHTGLTSLIIPSSITSIGNYVFNGCSGLTSIVVESGNTVYDSRENSNAIIETATNSLIVGCKNTIVPNSVTSIGDYAFFGCSGLTSVTIPNSVTSIGRTSFVDCRGLTSMTIPNSVTSIGDYAFSGCSGLTSIIVESGNSVFDSRNNCNAIIKTETNELITGCENTTIPNSVTSIGDYAFYNCSGLTSMTIPNSVTSIGDYAFEDCSGLTSVTIPNSVTNIGWGSFSGCSGLTEITSMIREPFSIYTRIFYDIPSGATLYVPVGTKEKYEATAGWNHFTNIVEMEVPELLFIDLTGDGNMTIADVTTLIGFINGETELDQQKREIADINKDGIINDADVTKLIDIIIGKEGQQE